MVILIGAELAVRRQKRATGPNPDPTDPDENNEWDITAPPGVAGPPTGGEGVLLSRLRALRRRLESNRHVLQMVDAALGRARSRRGKHMSVRERRRHKALCKLFRRRGLLIALLVAKREHLQGLVRVKALQVKKAQTVLERCRVRRAVQLGGPRALEKGQAARRKVSQEEGRAIAEYWKGLWQVAGCHTPGHSALADWGRKVRRAVAEAGETEGPWLGGLLSTSSPIGRLRGQME